jgi:S-formylglutathione hydrolase FrmB
MRRAESLLATIAAGLLGLGVLAAPARGARVVTWLTTSRYVDPAGPTLFNPPPGGGSRPNALRVNVYLPDGYDGQRRFPILWLLHGHGDGYDSWIYPGAGDLLHVAAGFPGIIVMPEGARGWYTDWWSGGKQSPGWESYYLRELMPLVERRLRILPGRSSHAIAGLSMGGEGAAYLAEQRPGYFGAVATFSGVLSIQRPEWPAGFNTQGEVYTTVYGPPDGFYATGHNPLALAANLAYTRVFVRVGDGVPAPSEFGNTFGIVAEDELHLHAIDFTNATRAAGAPTTLTVHQGIHAWPYWRRDLAAAIRWGFFRPVPGTPRSWTYQTVHQHVQAWDLRIDFVKQPASVERFVRDGRRLSGSGSGTVTIDRAGGCRLSARMPFDLTLPSKPCNPHPRRHGGR